MAKLTGKKKRVAERYTVAQVAKALRESDGRVSGTAAALKCSRTAVYGYLERYEALAEVTQEARENALDVAEDKLMKLVRAENLTAIIFYLKTQGKQRGYIERAEHDLNPGNRPVEFTIKMSEGA